MGLISGICIVSKRGVGLFSDLVTAGPGWVLSWIFRIFDSGRGLRDSVLIGL